MSNYSSEHKIPTYAIKVITNADPSFYELIGPILSKREIVDELGGPVWDDNGKLWYVAITGETKELLGVAAFKGDRICSLYVTPSSRGKCVGYALLNQVVTHSDSLELKATATEASRGMFISFGFTEVGTKGQYFLLTKGATDVQS
jgi:L-amino acid N-acyltransferase YncA